MDRSVRRQVLLFYALELVARMFLESLLRQAGSINARRDAERRMRYRNRITQPREHILLMRRVAHITVTGQTNYAGRAFRATCRAATTPGATIRVNLVSRHHNRSFQLYSR